MSAELSRALEAMGIRDPAVLRALAEVPRELFVPPHLRRSAGADHPLPIGFGQTISQPFVVAYMTEQLRPGGRMVIPVGEGPDEQVLRAVERGNDGADVWTDLIPVRFVPLTGGAG